MRRAPPIVPGTPAEELEAARCRRRAPPRATLRSSAAAPGHAPCRLVAMSAKPRPSRITTPRMPPSRTSRLEPTPITVTGTSAGFAREERREVVRIGRAEHAHRRDRRRGTRSSPASGARSRYRPRTAAGGRAGGRDPCASASSRTSGFGPPGVVVRAPQSDVRSPAAGRCAQLVMLPAPRQTTRSPAFASLDAALRPALPARTAVSTLRWPCARKPVDQRILARRPRSAASPAG